MITNLLLETKYQTQRQLDEEAEHDTRKYAENSHKITLEIEKLYGVHFIYGSPQEGQKIPEQSGNNA